MCTVYKKPASSEKIIKKSIKRCPECLENRATRYHTTKVKGTEERKLSPMTKAHGCLWRWNLGTQSYKVIKELGVTKLFL